MLRRAPIWSTICCRLLMSSRAAASSMASGRPSSRRHNRAARRPGARARQPTVAALPEAPESAQDDTVFEDPGFGDLEAEALQQAGFAPPAGPDQRHQPLALDLQQPHARLDLLAPPNETA